MIYSPTVTVPKNTPQSSPLVIRVPITLGLLYHFEVYFPPGPSGLVHVQLFDGAHQVYPSNETEDFIGDNITIAMDDLYAKEDAPSELQVVTWNLDDTFDQIIVVRFAILTDSAFQARFSPTTSNDQLSQIVTLLEAQQKGSGTGAIESLVNTFSTSTES